MFICFIQSSIGLLFSLAGKREKPKVMIMPHTVISTLKISGITELAFKDWKACWFPSMLRNWQQHTVRKPPLQRTV